MKLIPCAPPRGTLNTAPLTTLITPTMQQLETWDGFWGEDDVYYARLSASDGSLDAPRWFRVAPEAGTPIQGMEVVPPPATGAHTTSVHTTSVQPRSRSVMLCARLRRTPRDGTAATPRLAWGVVMRGARRRHES